MSSYLPENHNAVSPYLIVKDVKQQIEFLKTVFGAVLLFEIKGQGFSIKHASVKVDDSVIMIGERPVGREAVKCSTHVYVKNVDECYASAVATGALSISEPRDQPYGDRSAGIADLDGNLWWIGTYKGRA